MLGQEVVYFCEDGLPHLCDKLASVMIAFVGSLRLCLGIWGKFVRFGLPCSAFFVLFVVF